MVWKFLRKLKKYKKLILNSKDRKKYLYLLLSCTESLLVYIYSKYRYERFSVRRYCNENGSFCDKFLLVIFLIGCLYFFFKLIKII